MAHYVVSDIHGEADRFYAMLDKIQFSDEDTLYILGDVVDRGPDGVALLQKIMTTPNVVMILGNHECMMLDYLVSDPDPVAIRRWNKNGNRPTLDTFLKLKARDQRSILEYLRSLPTHLEIEINGKWFYLVHGFPGMTVHDEVWSRPTINTPNPVPGYQVIIGHTPVHYLIQSEQERINYVMDIEDQGNHLRIWHSDEFIDIDCGCGHEYSIRALACVRLEDMVEYYV